MKKKNIEWGASGLEYRKINRDLSRFLFRFKKSLNIIKTFKQRINFF